MGFLPQSRNISLISGSIIVHMLHYVTVNHKRVFVLVERTRHVLILKFNSSLVALDSCGRLRFTFEDAHQCTVLICLA